MIEIVQIFRIGLRLVWDASGWFFSRFSSLRLGEVSYILGALIKGRVMHLRVGEPDSVINDPFCSKAVSDFVKIDGLLLEGLPEPFDKDAIEITTASMP